MCQTANHRYLETAKFPIVLDHLSYHNPSMRRLLFSSFSPVRSRFTHTMASGKYFSVTGTRHGTDRNVAPERPTDTRPIVISGPSGVGKGTLYGLLFQRYPDVFTLSVSHTTRGPRPGESDGVHYHFVTKEAFQALREQGGFVERYVAIGSFREVARLFG